MIIVSNCINYKRCHQIVESEDMTPCFCSERCKKDYYMEYEVKQETPPPHFLWKTKKLKEVLCYDNKRRC